MDLSKVELKQLIKDYLKENLVISVDAYQGNVTFSDNYNIKVNVSLTIEGEQISYSDCSFDINKN